MGKTLRIRLTEEQRERLDKFASSAGKETSTWARDVLLAWRKKKSGAAMLDNPMVHAHDA